MKTDREIIADLREQLGALRDLEVERTYSANIKDIDETYIRDLERRLEELKENLKRARVENKKLQERRQ